MAGVEIFTKRQFEEALDAFCTYEALGQCQGNEAYLVDFGNPDAKIMVYSSVASNGKSRDTGEDSIRVWLVSADGTRPIGNKMQKYVKRTKSWRATLEKVVRQAANLGRWVQPCPACGQHLSLKIKGGAAYLFCPDDAKNRGAPGHKRHLPLMTLDKTTGEEINAPPPEATAQTCPTCGTPLARVRISKGKDKGKTALTCPKKEGGKFLNHCFIVQEPDAQRKGPDLPYRKTPRCRRPSPAEISGALMGDGWRSLVQIGYTEAEAKAALS